MLLNVNVLSGLTKTLHIFHDTVQPRFFVHWLKVRKVAVRFL